MTTNGCIGWKDGRYFVNNALAGERIGIIENDDAQLEVRFGPIPIGRLDQRKGEIARL